MKRYNTKLNGQLNSRNSTLICLNSKYSKNIQYRLRIKCKVSKSQEGWEKEKQSQDANWDKSWENIPELNQQDSDSNSDPDWREFRAKLVQLEKSWSNQSIQDKESIIHADPSVNLKQDKSIWAHLISQPERGCLLVSSASDLGFFNNTAILLLQHEDQKGSLGLILDRPSPLMVHDVFTRRDVSDIFGGETIYFGGPVGYDRIHVLHGQQCVRGGKEILRGVYVGGMDDACQLIQAGEANKEQFRLLFGYCGWDPFQLAAELHDESWYIVSASRELILRLIFGNYGEQGESEKVDRNLLAWNYLMDVINKNS
eukprot:TRINITY_DN2709_c0_g1_i1.p1 TRINITY_DN2709_c0_g1~~TRINITY_DN2709_c0_g1_i1.p1  ORF type:complete len:313 (+),score=24.09 TRINITY_DN2709_c0_g1_i1:181-1119(+)